MLTCAIGINLAKKTAISRKNVTFNLMTGLSWSIANLGMFLATAVLGVATSFSISQACVIVATIGGILIFKQKKKPAGMDLYPFWNTVNYGRRRIP